MNIIEIILENLMELLPFVMIFTYERGVRWTCGQNPKELLPGFHWRVWFIHHIEVIHVVDTFLNVPIQSVVTQDDQLVCFSVNIGYRITDTVKHFCEVTDFSEASIALSEIHLAERVRAEKYADLAAEGGLKKLENSLKGTLTTRVRDWGTEVFSVGFKDFAKTRPPLRIFGGLRDD